MDARQPDNRIGRPGAELLAILPRRWKTEGCGCDDFALKMDYWGVEGCIERIDEIVEKLVDESDRVRLLAIWPRTLREETARRLSWVAIKRARRAERASKEPLEKWPTRPVVAAPDLYQRPEMPSAILDEWAFLVWKAKQGSPIAETRKPAG